MPETTEPINASYIHIRILVAASCLLLILSLLFTKISKSGFFPFTCDNRLNQISPDYACAFDFLKVRHRTTPFYPTENHVVRYRWSLQLVPPASKQILYRIPGRPCMPSVYILVYNNSPMSNRMLYFQDTHLPPWAKNQCLCSHIPYFCCCFSRLSSLRPSLIQQICKGWHNISPVHNGYTMMDKVWSLFSWRRSPS